ncbi:MAG: ligase-associated DNA damage response DEXH box helicase [Bacteroidota bacterium]
MVGLDAVLSDQQVANLLNEGKSWYSQRAWKAFPFQIEMMEKYLTGYQGLLNAPTGSGKTYAAWIPILLEHLHLKKHHPTQLKKGLQAIWITPLRALSKDISHATQVACDELQTGWKVEIRTGDTSSSVKARQKRRMPEGLVTTPESMHVLFSSKNHEKLFEGVKAIVIDEWHELLGSKRGTQVELLIARIRKISPQVKVWGISATIGNMEEGMKSLLGGSYHQLPHALVKADIEKKIEVTSVLPEEIEKFPWSGHLGIHMVDHVLPIIEKSQSTLIFTNTRAQAEIWYRALLEAEPDLAGVLAMHHGSIAAETRAWVEQALHDGVLKVVVCTSSLDLGVDFRPVDTIIQVGGPKGVARFVQRAGRSGHRPGEVSRIYFVPTHSLELIEAAALRQAVAEKSIEDRIPIAEPLDVLIQYLVTLAVANGFYPQEVLEEVRTSWAYRELTQESFEWALDFITTGGKSLFAYQEYKKVEIEESGLYKVNSKRIALQHRLSIGTIVGDVNLMVKYVKGGKIGTIEESFITKLKPGDVFWFAGKSLELVRVRNMEVQVKKSKSKKGVVPRWMGSRMKLSSEMSRLLRDKMDSYLSRSIADIELEKLKGLLDVQNNWSVVPSSQECLIEYMQSREGYHLFIYPLEGRVLHEILGALCAWRISQLTSITFSIAMNDYGFELLSDQEIPIEEALEAGLFSPEGLGEDIMRSINQTEMANRRFREVATVSGLIFQGYPGKAMKTKHLQASTSLLFKVFQQYEPDSLLLQQAYNEVLNYEIDGDRLKIALERLDSKHIVLTRPKRFTPFCFPIMVDRLRERLTSEKLVDRIAKMKVQLEKYIPD